MVGEDRQLSNRLLTAHLWVGIFVAILLVAHIGAAFHHHFVRRDRNPVAHAPRMDVVSRRGRASRCFISCAQPGPDGGSLATVG